MQTFRHLFPSWFANAFYGWKLVFAACVIMGFSSGIVTYSATVFFIPVSTALGVNRTTMSAAYSLARAENFLLAPIVGYFIDRLGPKRPIIFGMTMAGFGLILFGLFTNSFLLFILTWTFMVSFGANIGGFAPNWAMINNWFNRKKGRAMGFGMAAQSTGGVLLAPVVAVLISTIGWRFAAIIAGVALLVVVLPFSMMIRTRPSDLGLLPDGDEFTDDPSSIDSSRSAFSNITHFTVREVAKTPAFWILNLAMGLRQLGQSGMIFHFSPLLQDQGFTAIMAGSTVGLLAFMGIGGAILGGWVSDRYERRRVMALIVFCETLALLVLFIATSTWHVYFFVLVYGFGGGAHALNRAILGEYFGQDHYAKIWGLLSMVTTPLAAAGPIFTGWVFDYFGNYDIAIATFVAVYALSSGAYFICRKPELTRES